MDRPRTPATRVNIDLATVTSGYAGYGDDYEVKVGWSVRQESPVVEVVVAVEFRIKPGEEETIVPRAREEMHRFSEGLARRLETWPRPPA